MLCARIIIGVQGLSYWCVWELSCWPIGVWGDYPIGAVCEGCSRLVWHCGRRPCPVRPSHCTWNVRRARGAYPLCVCIQRVTSLSFRTPATAPCIMLLVVVLVGARGSKFLREGLWYRKLLLLTVDFEPLVRTNRYDYVLYTTGTVPPR